jgi:hypothetical protein
MIRPAQFRRGRFAMANGTNPPEGRYSHLNISGMAEVGEYRRPARKITKKFVRADHDVHGAELERQLAQAYADAIANLTLRDPAVMAGEPGIYLHVEGLAGQSLGPLELRSKKIRLAALHATATGAETGALFLPDDARHEFERRIAEYRTEAGANRPNATHARFEPVEHIALGDLNSLWTSPQPFPEAKTWFEIWCYRPLVAQVTQVIDRLRLQISNEHLIFQTLRCYLFMLRSPKFVGLSGIVVVQSFSCGWEWIILTYLRDPSRALSTTGSTMQRIG